MNLLTTLVAFFGLISTSAIAHTDHGLGNGTFHEFYHVVFWLIFSAVIVKALFWFKTKKTNTKDTADK